MEADYNSDRERMVLWEAVQRDKYGLESGK
jgi:hypothetical protein